eukprot:3789506-Amphidinium_carterae.1
MLELGSMSTRPKDETHTYTPSVGGAANMESHFEDGPIRAPLPKACQATDFRLAGTLIGQGS